MIAIPPSVLLYRGAIPSMLRVFPGSSSLSRVAPDQTWAQHSEADGGEVELDLHHHCNSTAHYCWFESREQLIQCFAS